MKDRAYTSRREFLRRTATTAVAAGPLAFAQTARGKTVSIVADPSDSVAATPPARWAAKELAQTLSAADIAVHQHERTEQAGASDFVILVSSPAGRLAPLILKTSGITMPASPECLALAPGTVSDKPAVLACATDSRGLVYALLELADRARHASDPMAALRISKAIVERPANAVRSISGCSAATWKTSPGSTIARCGRHISTCWPRSGSIASTSLRHRLRLPARGHRRLLSVRLSRFCSRCPATTCASATARSRSATATWRCCGTSASRRVARGLRVPVGHLDARLCSGSTARKPTTRSRA